MTYVVPNRAEANTKIKSSEYNANMQYIEDALNAPVSGGGKAYMMQQAIINGNFDIWQRGTAFTSVSTIPNNDDTYLCDRWNLISNGNDAVDLSRDTDAPEGSKYSMLWDVETSAQFGIVQILENVDTRKLAGKTVSIRFMVKSANIAAIRAAILTWAGTADAVTSDVVSSWGATPTWAANWTQENTPADLTVTSSWTEVVIENIILDSATINNLALAIWLPNAETIGDTIRIAQVQINEGATALDFQPKTYIEELYQCQRYFFRADSAQAAFKHYCFGVVTSTTRADVLLFFPTAMRTIPALTASAGNTFVTNGVTLTTIALDTAVDTAESVIIIATVAAGLTVGQGARLYANNNTSTYLNFDAEL